MSDFVTRTFEVAPGNRVELVDLPGEVEVRSGPVGRVAVTVTGMPVAREQVDIGQVDGAVQVRGRRSGGGGVVCIGGDVIASQSMRSIAAGQEVVGLSADVISGSGVTGRIVINGVDVTDVVARPARPARVEVVVPVGTPVEVDGCALVEVDGVVGRVIGATGARVRASGQARAQLAAGSGVLDVTVSRLARVGAEGSHAVVDVEASEKARVDVHGDLGQVAGRASGMSTVAVTGQVGGHRLRTSGMATARINGRVTR